MEKSNLAVPEEGDTVKIINTDTDSVFAKGEVKTITVYSDDSDKAVYIELYKEPDNKVMFKKGYWEGEEYSWLHLSNYGGPEVEKEEYCLEYEIV